MRRSRFTYTNVTATLALFVALGGSSYAALTINGSSIRNGTLTGADVRNGSLAGRDAGNGALTGADLKDRSVASADVDDSSLTAADVDASTLAAGRAGPAGPPGPAGATSSIVRRSTSTTLTEGEEDEATAACGAGEVAVGGGADHDGTEEDLVSTVFAEPLEADGTTPEDGEQATAWRAGGNNFLGSGIERDMTVYVLCAKR